MYARKYNAEDIPFDKLNNIIYAFMNYEVDGKVIPYDLHSD